jgi:hypothetical protein
MSKSNSSGELISDTSIEFDWNKYEYYFKLGFSGGYDGSRGVTGSAKVLPFEIKYTE